MRGKLGLVAVALLLAACAGGNSATTGQSNAGPIKIGLLTSLTGNYAPLGTGDEQGAQLMVDRVNAQGGINGRKLELDIVNDGSDPNQTVVQLNRLDSDGVVALLGPPQSTADLAIKPLVNQKKLPTIALGAADQQTNPVTPYMWQTANLSSQVARDILGYLQQEGKTRLAMMYDSANAYAVAGHDETKSLMDRYGITLVDDESFQTSATNFTPEITRVVAAKPDFTLVWATGAPPVVITKQWAAANTGIPLMMTGAEATPLYVQPAGPAAEGVYLQVVMADIGPYLPASNRFKKIIDGIAKPFQAKYGTYPSQFSWDAITAMSFLIDAIKRKGATREAIRQGLDSISLDTANGHYTFTPTRHYGMPQSANTIAIVRNGQFVPAPGLTEQQLAKAGS
ncbi:MAG TPA: ABC transporter substrate-binding protein [Candidatus Dormibacteraeota bacterium]|nr:ABC transporter substrate-binding protein [Candidatus Dormibacteraeota bacterium]